MATQQDIIAAINGAEQHLNSFADQIRAQPNAPVPESDWTARDMLCHVAATSNFSALFGLVRRRGGGFPTMQELDEGNSQALAQRADRSVDELLDEATRGYAGARTAVGQLTDDQLAQPAPSPDGSPMTIGDLLVVLYSGHADDHISSIEQAVSATA